MPLHLALRGLVADKIAADRSLVGNLIALSAVVLALLDGSAAVADRRQCGYGWRGTWRAAGVRQTDHVRVQ